MSTWSMNEDARPGQPASGTLTRDQMLAGVGDTVDVPRLQVLPAVSWRMTTKEAAEFCIGSLTNILRVVSVCPARGTAPRKKPMAPKPVSVASMYLVSPGGGVLVAAAFTVPSKELSAQNGEKSPFVP